MIPRTHEIQTTSSMMFGKLEVEIHPLSGIKKAAKFGANFCMCGKRRAVSGGLSAGAEGFLADFRLLRTLIPLECACLRKEVEIYILYLNINKFTYRWHRSPKKNCRNKQPPA